MSECINNSVRHFSTSGDISIKETAARQVFKVLHIDIFHLADNYNVLILQLLWPQ